MQTDWVPPHIQGDLRLRTSGIQKGGPAGPTTWQFKYLLLAQMTLDVFCKHTAHALCLLRIAVLPLQWSPASVF